MIVVDSVPAGTQTWSDCGTTTSDGTFQFTFSPDSDGRYEAKGDLAQIGGGYQGHFWYTHDRDAAHLGGDGGRMTVLGDWKLNSPLPEHQAQVYVHIPDTGAQTGEAVYQIVTPFGTVNKTISQYANESDKWVSLGAYRFNNQAPEVKLSNTNSTGTGDQDIAWDAVAFVPGDFSGMPTVDFPAEDPNAPDPDDIASQTPDDAPAPVPVESAVGSLTKAPLGPTARRAPRTGVPPAARASPSASAPTRR